jgi:hypothetical protein
MAIAFTGATVAVAILVVLKTLMDVGSHVAEHRGGSLPPETAPTS